MNNEIRDLIFALTLENALKYKGKPNKGSIIGKLVYLKPEIRPKLKELISLIDEIIGEVEKLSYIEQENLFNRYKNLILVKKEKQIVIDDLPPLPNAEEGKVVTRFAPNPDFVLHLGSVRPLLFSYLYAKKYNGKFILRFEDTDPRTKRPRIEFYKLILEDIKWLGLEPDEIYYQSDRLEIYYDVAEKLIEKGYGYVCTCDKEYFSQLIARGEPCPHRNDTPEDNLHRLEMMINGDLKEGKAVFRIKTDLNHPNPSIRDWAALRIIDTKKYPHPRTGSKYFVWPLYNFSCPIDDHYMGVTHVIRGAEHKINEEKQRYIYKYMGWRAPIGIHHGRIAIPGGVLSKSKILRGIEEGIYSGIDDPQLATLAALRRRGFLPEAIKRVILRSGLKAGLTTIDWSLLAAENRVLIDDIANRYFGVRVPKKIMFKYPAKGDIEINIRLHPEHPERGMRKLKITAYNDYYVVYIDRNDYKELMPGDIFRLIALGNFSVKEKEESQIIAHFINNDVKWAKKKNLVFIHWLPQTNIINSIFIYPDDVHYGYIENNILNEKIGAYVQLERIGFFKIEKIQENKITVIFIHN